MNLNKEVLLIDPEKTIRIEIFDELEQESLLFNFDTRKRILFLVSNKRLERLVIPPRIEAFTPFIYPFFALYSILLLCIPIIHY